jgi:hypothetical protein
MHQSVEGDDVWRGVRTHLFEGLQSRVQLATVQKYPSKYVMTLIHGEPYPYGKDEIHWMHAQVSKPKPLC